MGLRMMCVVAHPDDECFAFGGALALASARGVETLVICLTDGQAASNRGEAQSGKELGRLRREEFAASCRVLGVTNNEILNFQDGQLEHVEFSGVARTLVQRMRTFRPDVVLTFSLDGGLNTHPDHTMASAFACAAFHWAASSKRFPELGTTHHAERLYVLSTNFFMDDRPAPLPTPWTVKLDVSAVTSIKQEAFRQHTSQAPLMEQTKVMFEKHGESEYYTLLASRLAQSSAHSTNLFEGLEG